MRSILLLGLLVMSQCSSQPEGSQSKFDEKLFQLSSEAIIEGQSRYDFAEYEEMVKEKSLGAAQAIFVNVLSINEVRLTFLESVELDGKELEALNRLLEKLKKNVDSPNKLDEFYKKNFYHARNQKKLKPLEKERLKLEGLLLIEEALSMNLRNVSSGSFH